MTAYKLILNGSWEMDPGRLAAHSSSAPCREQRGPGRRLPRSDLQRRRFDPGAPFLRSGHVRRPPEVQPGARANLRSIPTGPRRDGTAAERQPPGTAQRRSPAPTFDPVARHDRRSILSGLADGKYSAFVSAKDKAGNAPAEPLRLVFWIEPEAFDWHDALIYMTSDRSLRRRRRHRTTPPPLANVDRPREQYQGGDLRRHHRPDQRRHLRRARRPRALALTPSSPGPPTLSSPRTTSISRPATTATGRSEAREVDPRIGGEASH